MTPPAETIQELHKSKTVSEIAAMYGVQPRTAQYWVYGKGKPRGKPNKMRAQTDRMLSEGKPIAEIRKAVGCCKTYVYDRRRLLAGRKVQADRRVKVGGVDRKEPAFIPFEDRFARAIRCKANALGVPMAFIREKWLPMHYEFMQEYL